MDLLENSYQTQAELVITAPEPYAAHLAYRARARLTLGVLTQLISQSKRSLILAAPFVQPSEVLHDGPLSHALQVALRNGVNVDIVSTGSGLRTIDIQSLQSIATGGLRFYRPLANVDNDRRLGSHAKFCIADGQHAYIGSANLTSPGLSEHLEMGVLIHGELASRVEQFWRFLTEIRFFVEVNL